MFLKKLRMVATGLSLIVVGGSISAWTALSPEPTPQSPQPNAVRSSDAAQRASHDKILYGRGGNLYLMDADGKKERQLDLPAEEGAAASLSPDGRKLAYWVQTGEGTVARVALCIRNVDGKEPASRIDLPFECGFIQFFWSPDGTELLVNTGAPGVRGLAHVRVNVKTKKVTPLNVLGAHLATDWTPEGKYLLTTAVGTGEELQPKGIYLIKMDGSESRALTRPKDETVGGRISPDGKRVLCWNNQRLSVFDVGKPESLTPVAGVAEDTEVVHYTWSPDGKHILYSTGMSRLLDAKNREKLESRLIVADPDGKNAQVLRSVKGDLIQPIDWR